MRTEEIREIYGSFFHCDKSKDDFKIQQQNSTNVIVGNPFAFFVSFVPFFLYFVVQLCCENKLALMNCDEIASFDFC